VERFARYFKKVLAVVLEDPGQCLSEIEIISDEEKRRILTEFNDTFTAYPKDKTIHRLFEEQVERNPDTIAVEAQNAGRSERCALTYRELNDKSKRLADLLKAKGVKHESNSIVGIMEERSLEMIVGILTVLKVGAAYLPIDPDYPQERVRFMLADSSAKFLLKKSESPRRGHPIPIVLNLENLNFDIVSNFVLRASNLSSSELAYIMYTSGSTGEPKGVMVEHRNVVRLVKNANYVELSEETRILLTGAVVFDATTFEIWGALLNGGRLCLENKDVIMDACKFSEALKKYRVNVLWLTAPLFNRLVQENSEMFSTLEWLLVGGDVLSPGHINRVRSKNKRLKVVNGYGPTENTTFSTCYLIDGEFDGNIPIGKPISNSTVYILDNTNHLQPVGVVGELCVGGDGVSRGYLNNPELTAKKFKRINMSYMSYMSHMSYIYKTGDLARWLPDGNVEFLGRVDHQVKIRGFRIEPGEIETHLLTHDRVREAVVVVARDQAGDNYLCAYIVPHLSSSTDSITSPGKARLIEYLSGRLPHYMIPSHFLFMERLPLTPTGKLDRKALPLPEAAAAGTGVEYAAPRNEMEETLAFLWSEVLGVEKEIIGIDDNFFQMGGHSLKATTLISKIHKAFNVRLSLGEIFEAPVIRVLSRYIRASDRDKHDEYIAVEAMEKKEYYALSPAQKRLYVIQRISPESTNYNMPIVVTLEGALEREKLENAFKELISRHESLRTSIEIIDHQPVQKIHDEVEFKIEYYDLATGGRADTHLSSGFIRPFDLSKSPFLRVGLIKTGEETHILMVDMHHIISDGSSLEIFLKDIMALYRGERLPGLRLQYKDFSQWQNNRVISGEMKKQEEYWFSRFKGEIPRLKMPVDYTRPVKKTNEGNTVDFEVAGEEAEKLRDLAKKEEVTMFMVLLTMFNILLFKLGRQEDIIVGTVLAGRRHPDLENIIGMFVNTLPLRNFPGENKTFIEFLRETRKRALEVFDNQDYPFDLLVDKLTVERDTGRNPLFDVLFSFNAPTPGGSSIQLEKIEKTGLNVKPYEWGEGEISQAKFDMIFSGRDGGDCLFLVIEYSMELFKKETIERFIMYFKEVVSAVTENESIKLKDITISHDLVIAVSDVYQGAESDFEFKQE